MSPPSVTAAAWDVAIGRRPTTDTERRTGSIRWIAATAVPLTSSPPNAYTLLPAAATAGQRTGCASAAAAASGPGCAGGPDGAAVPCNGSVRRIAALDPPGGVSPAAR